MGRMITAIIFELEGTLINTGKLKATSYAQAAVELGGGAFSEQPVIDAYKEVAGFSRMEITQFLLKRFGIETQAAERMDAYRVGTPWQAFVQIRMKLYGAMLEDPLAIVKHRCPHSLDLLIWAGENNFKTGLVSSAGCSRTHRVLQILDVANEFDFIATGDDVNRTKPDPEIYRLMAHELCIDPQDGLVLESSPAGIESASAAGMHCIAVLSDMIGKPHRDVAFPAGIVRVEQASRLKKAVKDYVRG
jgi:beta-phosphoglucomutase-like phosphatase (HAD superfamily)